MARLFGTDGVRGIANTELSCELAFRLGQASAYVLASDVHRPTILVGRDTRLSGEMLESALVAGICSVGARAVLVEVLPTPAIAYLTRFYEADAGAVISASHNTVEYNGIKFFDKNGYKLPDAIEDRIEEIVTGGMPTDFEMPIGERVGRPVRQRNATRRYVDFVKETTNVRLDGLHVVLDCAQGASYEVAPMVFKELGAKVSCYYHEPDGTNINDNCGSTHPRRLCELVRELGADVGFAFDGDADRLMAVDERGQLINGDQVMAMLALHLKEQGRLRQNTVVATVMSNMGLDIAMKKHGIKIEKTRVGDRYVLEKMLEEFGCETDFIPLKEGNSRINVKINAGTETEINGQGPVITEEAIQALYEKLDKLEEGDVLILAGSIPNTLPEDIYERILERLSGKEIRFVVDATKDLLLKVMKYHPFLIKPNNHELGEMFNVELKRKEDIIIYAKKLQALGAQHVLVSMAGDGAILVTKDGKVYETMPPKGKVVNSVGAGDSMVAGFITGYLNTKDMEKAFRLGVAAGSASAFCSWLATRDEIVALLGEPAEVYHI